MFNYFSHMPNTKSPHQRLAEYRNKKGWGMREMAAALNCSATMIGPYERGERTPDAYRVRRAAQQLIGIGLDEWDKQVTR